MSKAYLIRRDWQPDLRDNDWLQSRRQYEESTSFTLRARSCENQLIRSGVHCPDRTRSTSLRCHSRLNAQSFATSTTSISAPLCLDHLDPHDADVFLDDMANLSVHRDTVHDTLQAVGPRARSKSPQVPGESLRYERIMRRASRKRMTVAVWCPEWPAAS